MNGFLVAMVRARQGSRVEGGFSLLTSEQMRLLTEALASHGEILSAYLFGSRSLGCDHKESDADVAVRFADKDHMASRFEIQMALQAPLEAVFQGPVDIVGMNDASLIMLHQIFSYGMPLFIRDLEDEERFKWKKLKEFFDFRYYLDKDAVETKRYFEKADHG